MASLSDIRRALVTEVARGKLEQLPCHVAAFVSWVTEDEQDLRAHVEKVANLSEQMRNPEHVAALGFAAAGGLLSDDERAVLLADLAHLSGRQFFAVNRPLRFEIDGVALFGVALGIVHTDGADSDAGEWLRSLLPRSCSELGGDEWQLGLARSALFCLGEASLLVEPADLGVALAGKGMGAIEAQDLEEGWKLSSELKSHEFGPARDAVRLAAFDQIIRYRGQISIGAMTRESLVELLQGLVRSMRHWTYEHAPRTKNSAIAKWEVENEYHVQSLLWTILAPVFPDLEDEENLDSIGQKKPRADLCVPSLRTIIEVKFMRRSGQRACAEIIGEIGEDASLYLSKSRNYDNIVCFIWDDVAHTEQHAELKAGLESIRGISAAVILPRPGKMLRTSNVEMSD